MPKKKTHDKKGGKTTSAKGAASKKAKKALASLKSSAKKTPRKAKQKQIGSKLEHWKQRPGTFTYELVHENGIKWVCQGKHEMNDEDLFMQFILHSTFDMAEPMKPGEMKVFNAVDDPMETFGAMFKNPPPGWKQHVMRLVIQHRVEHKQRVQRKLKRELLGKAKPGKKQRPFYQGICLNCHGRLWVCEDHPTLPWEMEDQSGCPCHAPGMACPECNPKPGVGIGPSRSLLFELLKKEDEGLGDLGFRLPPSA